MATSILLSERAARSQPARKKGCWWQYRYQYPDYHQAKVANDQSDVIKRLTVIASVLLLPAFIVGLYGQNFVDIPELHWHYGYAYGWGLIVVTTIAQLAFFKWKKWLYAGARLTG